MTEFEALLALLLVAVVLAAVARKTGAPYPAFLALGGAVLAFVPGVPALAIEPHLALALFVAPVLLDAAYDASLRDLKDNWPAVASLVVVSVGLTTVAVAWVARALVPSMPWAAAIALGAIVAPPDAAAATAVLRQVRPPHRILTILEGESLLNDASALLIYRLAIRALAANTVSFGAVAPTLLLVVVGSVAAGTIAARVYLRLTQNIRDVPTAIILQFIGTFGIWLIADRIGLSGVLTVVCYAVAVARRAPELTPARIRIPSYAVWETAVFVLNVLAFVFIGLQIRPILAALGPAEYLPYVYVAGAVLVTVIVVRFAWVMTHVALVRWRIRRFGFHPPRPAAEPSVAGAVVVSWCGMRGIVSLAAALALPAQVDGTAFPFRDLILLTAFSVVLGTLVIQGLTLRPLLQLLRLEEDNPVEHEVATARARALAAAIAALGDEASDAARAVREELAAHLRHARGDRVETEVADSNHQDLHRRAVGAARQAIFDLRANDDIGDDAFHRLEEELDWIEMGTSQSTGR